MRMRLSKKTPSVLKVVAIKVQERKNEDLDPGSGDEDRGIELTKYRMR